MGRDISLEIHEPTLDCLNEDVYAKCVIHADGLDCDEARELHARLESLFRDIKALLGLLMTEPLIQKED